jgi:hypothetical protein
LDHEFPETGPAIFESISVISESSEIEPQGSDIFGKKTRLCPQLNKRRRFPFVFLICTRLFALVIVDRLGERENGSVEAADRGQGRESSRGGYR